MIKLVAGSAMMAALATGALAQGPPANPSFAFPPPANDGARPGNVIGTGNSLPLSSHASNLDPATTHSELAPRLPTPAAGEDIQSLLLAARQALAGSRTGEAQEALERAETRSLDRSVVAGTQGVPASGALTSTIGQARGALAAGNIAQAVSLIDAALPAAAQADVPQ